MRVLGTLCRFELVSRTQAHDLLIRGPFAEGSTRRRWLNRGLRWREQIVRPWRRPAGPLRLHVSSENPFAQNYQNFEQSGCDFGLGHELRVGDLRYQRMPHWWNYVDFSSDGVPSPGQWIRLGEPLKQEQLLRPLDWNRSGAQRAAFVASYLNDQRRYLWREVDRALPVDGFGRAFDTSIADHTRSNFIKRELLRGFRFNLCPENAIAPGYYTEKIPESFACGAIPIGYVDRHAEVDFNPQAFLNLYDYLPGGIAEGLAEDLANSHRLSDLTQTPLLKVPVAIDVLVDFLRKVLDQARTG